MYLSTLLAATLVAQPVDDANTSSAPYLNLLLNGILAESPECLDYWMSELREKGDQAVVTRIDGLDAAHPSESLSEGTQRLFAEYLIASTFHQKSTLVASEEEAAMFFERHSNQYIHNERRAGRFIPALFRDYETETDALRAAERLYNLLENDTESFHLHADAHFKGKTSTGRVPNIIVGNYGVLSEVAFALEVGEVSKPFHAETGYFIFKLEEIQEKRPKTFEEAQDEVSRSATFWKRSLAEVEFATTPLGVDVEAHFLSLDFEPDNDTPLFRVGERAYHAHEFGNQINTTSHDLFLRSTMGLLRNQYVREVDLDILATHVPDFLFVRSACTAMLEVCKDNGGRQTP